MLRSCRYTIEPSRLTIRDLVLMAGEVETVYVAAGLGEEPPTTGVVWLAQIIRPFQSRPSRSRRNVK